MLTSQLHTGTIRSKPLDAGGSHTHVRQQSNRCMTVETELATNEVCCRWFGRVLGRQTAVWSTTNGISASTRCPNNTLKQQHRHVDYLAFAMKTPSIHTIK